MALVRVEDYKFSGGWTDETSPAEKSNWCCEHLEDSNILFFPETPFQFPRKDVEYLLAQGNAKSSSRKNITFDPKTSKLRGVDEEPAATELRQAMQRYSANVVNFLREVLAPYAPHWNLYLASYRPEEESSRGLETLKRNDLIHTDAFNSTPTHGARILRCFTNINPTRPRVWNTTDTFPTLAQKYADAAGLKEIAASTQPKAGALQKLLGKKSVERSNYDAFMLRFHDFLKLNEEYQHRYPKQQIEFPPNSTWMCFTDAVPHAVLTGQFALEQTLIVPLDAMVTPQKSPLCVLENLAGRPLAGAV